MSSPPPPEPKPKKPKKEIVQREYTLEELRLYDGKHPEVDNQIFIAVKGKIFDVSERRDFYGGDAAYGVFAGKDASLGLATSGLENVEGSIENLNLSERDSLDQW